MFKNTTTTTPRASAETPAAQPRTLRNVALVGRAAARESRTQPRFTNAYRAGVAAREQQQRAGDAA